MGIVPAFVHGFRAFGCIVAVTVLAVASKAANDEPKAATNQIVAPPNNSGHTADGTRRKLRSKADHTAALRVADQSDLNYESALRDAAEFVLDRSNDAKDRYEVRSAIYSVELRRVRPLRKMDRLAQRTEHARKLMREFPDDLRGYSYFMQVAASYPGEEGKRTAGDLLFEK